MRAALYARYSTDRQRETSIDDQLRAARTRAEAEGWQIVAQHGDEGVSGSVPVALRAGGKALLADLLGPVELVRDAEGDWAELEETAARLALAGSPVGVVAGARNAYRRRVRVR